MKIEFLEHVEILRKEWEWKCDMKFEVGGEKGRFDVHHEGYQSCVHYAVLGLRTSPR